MSKFSQPYEPVYTRTFDKQLRKIGDKLRIKRIKETVEKILENPYHQIEFSKGSIGGKENIMLGKVIG